MPSCFDLVTEVEEVIQEIMVYKWLESEKAGYDIGQNRATEEWIERHYPDWLKANAGRFMRHN